MPSFCNSRATVMASDAPQLWPYRMMRALFFGGCQCPIVIRVQQTQDFLSGIFSVVALESLHVHARGVRFAQARRELHFAVDGIIVPDEPADETHDNDGRRGAGRGRGEGIRSASGRKPRPLCRDSLAKHENSYERKDRSANRSVNSTK